MATNTGPENDGSKSEPRQGGKGKSRPKRQNGKVKNRSNRPCGAHVGPDKRSMWVLDEKTGAVIRVHRGEEHRYEGMPTITARRGSAMPPAAAFHDRSALPGEGYRVAVPVPARNIDSRVESALARAVAEGMQHAAPQEVKATRKEALAAIRLSADPDRAAQGMIDALAAGMSSADALAAGLDLGNRSRKFLQHQPLSPTAESLTTKQRIALAEAATLARTDRNGRVDALVKPVGGKGTVLISLAIDTTERTQPADGAEGSPATTVDALDITDENAVFSSPAQLMTAFVTAMDATVTAAAGASTVEELEAASQLAGQLEESLRLHVHAFAGEGDLGVFLHDVTNTVEVIGLRLFSLQTGIERGWDEEKMNKIRGGLTAGATELAARAEKLTGQMSKQEAADKAGQGTGPAPAGEDSVAAAAVSALEAVSRTVKVEERNGRVYVRATIAAASSAAVADALGLPAPAPEITVTADGRPVATVPATYRGGRWEDTSTVDISGTRAGVEALVRHHLERGGASDTYELAALYERGATPDDLPFEQALPALLTEHAGPVRSLGELEVRLAGLTPPEVLPPAVVARANALPETAHSATLGPLPVSYRGRDSAELLIDTVLHIGDPRIAVLPATVAGRPTTVTVARFDDRDRITRVEQVPVEQLQQRHAAFVNRRFDDPVAEVVEKVRLEVATGAAAAAAQYAAGEGIDYQVPTDPKRSTDAQKQVERVGFYAHTQPRRDLGAVATALHVLSGRPEVIAAVSDETRAVMVESSATLRNYDAVAQEIVLHGEYRRTEPDGTESVWTSIDQLRSPFPSPLKSEARGSRDRARQAEYEAERARLVAALGEALSVSSGRTLDPDEVEAAADKVMGAASRGRGYAKRLAAAAVDYDRRHYRGDVEGPGIF